MILITTAGKVGSEAARLWFQRTRISDGKMNRCTTL